MGPGGGVLRAIKQRSAGLTTSFGVPQSATCHNTRARQGFAPEPEGPARGNVCSEENDITNQLVDEKMMVRLIMALVAAAVCVSQG